MICDKTSVRSFNLNPWVLAFCVSTTVLLLQIIVTQYGALNVARQNNEFHAQSRDIEREIIRDLMYQLEQSRASNSALEQRGYVSGVVESITRPDHFSDIWHSGYSRGVEVQEYANSLDRKEKKYTGPEPVKSDTEKNEKATQ